ncbi:ribonuclease BN [Natronorubrum sulfidifaciens JCM 14089]|uniref:Ribonuclease BN n=2 Tax=Natronorubrum sulfidifaciens TaxID=388259 RepID=L9W2D8_9EURY|nr:ribonuclease BN [Natronorubrum sulfidifaciens JCM 14089]
MSFGKTVVDGVQEKNVPFMAASIAYQAFISLLPLLVLVFFFVTIVGDETFAAEVTATTEGVLPDSGQLLVEESLEDSPATAGSTIIGVVVLLWGSLKIFRGLDTAFSEIYGTTGENSFLEQFRDALIVFGAIGGALIAAAATGIVFAFLPSVPGLGVVQSLLLVVVLTAAFYPMYYYFPDVGTSRREVIPGVVFAAVGWMALQSLFRVYVSFAAGSEGAGPVGAILLLLTWLYFGGLILLSGAVVNAVGTGYLEPGADAESDETEPFVDDDHRERKRLAERATTLERERNQAQADLHVQRKRCAHLEDRVAALEARNQTLEAETERVQQELDERTGEPSTWRRLGRAALSRVQVVKVGTVERDP